MQTSPEYQRPECQVEIIAMGMVTPVGVDAKMTAASVRSGISAYQSSPFLNKQFNPMVLSLVPDEAIADLDDALQEEMLSLRQKRMLRLATPAIAQLEDKLTDSIPLMLCGPEKLPGKRSIISDKFLQYLAIQTKAPIDLDNSYVFPQGRASGMYALEAAMQMLQSGQHSQVLVGGVDTYLDLHLLSELDIEDRVLAEGVMDAFAPGEAAAFLLLRLAGPQTKIKVYPPGIADEPGHRYSELPYKGDGLANAIREAFNSVPSANVKTIFASFNGENFSAKEWGVASLRNQKNIDNDFDIQHPADCYGDLGAATTPVLLALAYMGMSKGYYQKPALVWASSEVEQRAAVCLV